MGPVAGAAAGWPLAARAQQRLHCLAFVHSGVPADKLTESAGSFWVRRVYATLRELGDVEGSSLIVERFSAERSAFLRRPPARDFRTRSADVGQRLAHRHTGEQLQALARYRGDVAAGRNT